MAGDVRAATGPRPAASPGGPSRRRVLLRGTAAAGVVAAAHAWVSLDAVAPVQTKDEIGYLAAARWLATGEGGGLLAPDFAGGYAAGWGLLTAPLWWLTSSPPAVYAASVAVSVLLAVVLLVPATLLARRLGAGPDASVLVAVVVCLGAGRLGYTGYALPEGLLTVQLTTLAWLLLRLAGTRPGTDGARPGGAGPPWATLAGLAVVLAWLPTTHARLAPGTALALLVLAAWAWSRRTAAPRDARAGAVAVVLGAAGAVAGWLLNAHVETVLYGDVARTAVAADQAASLRPADVLALAVGHAWYAAAAWAGLAVVGWLSLLRPAAAELRGRGPGAATWLVLVAPGQLLVGAAYLSTRLDVGARVDQLVYGRYGDPLWAVLAVAGGAALVSRRAPARLLGTALAATAAVSAAALLVLRAVGDRAQGFVQLNVPGLEAWGWRDGDRFVVPWAPATALAVGVLAVLLLLLRPGPGGVAPGPAVRAGALAGVGVLLLGLALVAEQRNIEPRDAWIRQMFTARALVDARPGAPVLLVEDRPLLLTGTAMQWWLADRDPVLLRDGDPVPADAPDGTLVMGPVGAPPPAPGATLRLLGVEPSGSYAVWVLEG